MRRSYAEQESGRDCGNNSSAGRYMNSVSDLYGSDEIEVLLEEIRELSPGSFHADSFQDFEIDGSRTGVDTVVVEVEEEGQPPGNKCQSLLSIHSWDSHAVYRQQLEDQGPPDDPVFAGVILYCDNTHLKSCTGVLRVILVISSVACLACLCTSGTAKATLFMLPLIGRLRFMIFVTVFTLLLTCLLLFLDISHLVYVFPFNWRGVNAILYVIVSVMYFISSSLVMNTVQFYNESYHWIPKWTKEQLSISGTLGYMCATEAILLSLATQFGNVERRRHQRQRQRQAKADAEAAMADHLSLVERRSKDNHNPQFEVPPSTSTMMWPIDDVQPCSSKHLQPPPLPANAYRVA